ncbi:UDP-3-O-[3-hydroxymyristoyl] N-acetylglucosamine deacetylase [Desulfacinum hydrothermale DSM 13146]|uniref:UDP-3-O-acyl-N-acetylglucosamine deacetylase n=1 Tax=Desulfacinum hydrothermale DSM 13146 TaxID=1121390 RepID=A0A1W1XFL8_9BACT|nr:UDP-3-O-acyl-N-acetylglucosamine deacetylase [Desulfacinum hydrothermale]SMC22753.1 UDP-3-O-[3-hydroxymyristoyl] N-acetylglucosamine deacetylase [Desulfacinum hydrothermale DSM 13146]
MHYDLFSQHTVGAEAEFGGTGLHSGARVNVRLRPAPPHHGIVFYRVDLPGNPAIAARHDNVVDTSLATVLGSDGVRVGTVEHFMAAVRVLGIDNLRVEIDGPEMPVMDGSAVPYLEVLARAGLERQEASKTCLRVESPFTVRQGDAYVRVRPADVLHIDYTIDFPHPLVGRQHFAWRLDAGAFRRELAAARTFGFLREVEYLQSKGLALGGSLDNAVVFDDHGVLNAEGLRFPDECVRHKVLDFLGDLALCPFPVFAHFEAHKAGHALHNQVLREMFRRPGHARFIQAATAIPQKVIHQPVPSIYWKPPVLARTG